jgi:hypothetical protein
VDSELSGHIGHLTGPAGHRCYFRWASQRFPFHSGPDLIQLEGGPFLLLPLRRFVGKGETVGRRISFKRHLNSLVHLSLVVPTEFPRHLCSLFFLCSLGRLETGTGSAMVAG